MGLVKCYECGGFISVSQGGTIQSPGYPGNYPNYTRCIWILQAPAEYVPRLNVSFEGETYNSQCSDYVEFRDGGQTGDVILKNCGTMTYHIVKSTSRWMYVLFSSDGFSQVQGLSATYSGSYVGTTNNSIIDPITNCRTYEIECRNKLCVSQSYRCDGFYDCGCGTDCDEDGCGGLSLTESQMKLIGVWVGIVVFLVAAIAGLGLEKHHNWEKEKQIVGEPTRRKYGWHLGTKKTGSFYVPEVPEKSAPRITACTIKVSETA